MLVTRRYILTAAAAGGVAPFAVRAAHEVEGAQVNSQDALNDWDFARWSPALVDNATWEFARAANRTRTRTLRSADVRVVASNARALVLHFDEIGLNASMGRASKRRYQELMYRIPTDHEAQGLGRALAEKGLKLSADEVRRMLSPSPDRRAEALADANRVGILGLERDAIADLEKLGQRMAAAGP